MILATFGTLIFLFLDRYGLRKLEFFFGFLIFIMTASFGYQVHSIEPSINEMSNGILDFFNGWDGRIWRQAVGIIGSVIMPRNLILHSALVKTRKIDRKDRSKVREANFYFFLEAAVSIAVSFAINILVVTIFAEGLHGKTNLQVVTQCQNSSLHEEAKRVFVGEEIKPDVYNAGIFLGCSFGVSAM